MSSSDTEHLDAKNSKNKTHKTHSAHVMCFGTFDIFHPGHAYYLSEAKKLGDTITIVIARDHRVFSGKWRDPVYDELTRLQTVQEHFPTAHVVLWDESDIFAPLREYQPDLLVFGYDQRVPEDLLRQQFPDIEIQRIWGFEVDIWKSSLLRNQLNSN